MSGVLNSPPMQSPNLQEAVLEEGSRVVMRPGQRWQGVGSLTHIHDSQLTCAVKWDSGRMDRSLKVDTVMVKKSGSTPAADATSVSWTPPASPGVPDQHHLFPPSETPPSLSSIREQPAAQPSEVGEISVGTITLNSPPSAPKGGSPPAGLPKLNLSGVSRAPAEEVAPKRKREEDPEAATRKTPPAPAAAPAQPKAAAKPAVVETGKGRAGGGGMGAMGALGAALLAVGLVAAIAVARRRALS